MSGHLQQFEQRLHQAIPLTAHMGLSITELTEQAVTVTAPLANNHNVHGSAFAGSLYSLCAVASWTLLNYVLEQAGVGATVVVRDANIQYKRPVSGDISIRCLWPALDKHEFFEQLSTDGKADVPFEIRLQKDDRDILVFTTQMAAVAPKG